MKVARGNTRKILKKVGNIQDLIGQGIGYHWDDKNPNSYEKAQKLLQQAFDLCLEIRNEYKQTK